MRGEPPHTSLVEDFGGGTPARGLEGETHSIGGEKPPGGDRLEIEGGWAGMTLAISIITGTISRVPENAMSGRRSPSLENCGLLVHCFELGQQTRQITTGAEHSGTTAQ